MGQFLVMANAVSHESRVGRTPSSTNAAQSRGAIAFHAPPLLPLPACHQGVYARLSLPLGPEGGTRWTGYGEGWGEEAQTRGEAPSPALSPQAGRGEDLRRPASTISQTRCGVSGSSRGSTPNALRAFATAFATMPPAEMMPPSPAPLAPSGLTGDGNMSVTMARRLGKSLAVGSR